MHAGTGTGELRERWEAAGQGGVFRFWDGLDASAHARLAAQLESIDLGAVCAGWREALARPAVRVEEIAPAQVVRAISPETLAALRESGEDLLARGEVAVLTVAGGQGTRLGFDGPKGAFPIGPVSDRSLFALFAQGVAGHARRSGCALPWIVLTSPGNDAATRRFFARHAHFSLPAGDVRFVVQATLPVLGLDGQILLERPDRVAEAADGHGGVFAALLASGTLAELEARGIQRIFYHHVDNPLVRIADPAYLGLHAQGRAEMSCKLVEKRDPFEKVGFLCSRAGRTAVLEYSEVPPELAAARDEAGQPRFWAGSIGIHVLDVAFVRRVAEGPALPLHLARKPVATVDAAGRPVTPAESNGHKLERFVFDALARAGSVAVMETRRQDEYSPVKNARGEASPESARGDLVASYRRWIAEAGLEAPGDSVAIEVDHSRFDGPEELRRSGLRRISEAAPHVRIAHGAER